MGTDISTPATAEYEELVKNVASALDLPLTGRQTAQLAVHFSLLVHWNRRINLTSVRRSDEIAVRHFGESLFLVQLLRPTTGLLVDVGSGAGFPGLPVKIACPDMKAVLLEPTRKKEAFLKEVIRHCELVGIEARAERLEEAAKGSLVGRASLVTLRAVALTPGLLSDLKKLLAPEGRLALFLGEQDALALKASDDAHWESPVPLPRSERRVVLIGRRADRQGQETGGPV